MTSLDFKALLAEERARARAANSSAPEAAPSPAASLSTVTNGRSARSYSLPFRLNRPIFDARAHSVACGVSGVAHVCNWLDDAEEQELLACADSAPEAGWTKLRNRRLQQFGGQPVPPPEQMTPEVLPGWVQSVCDALVRAGVFPPDAPPNHVLLNEYSPGQGIDAHKDGPLYYPRVAIISLGSHAAFEFLADNTSRQRLAAFLLPVRGLLIFEGAAYHDALHTVPARKADDLSELLPLEKINRETFALTDDGSGTQWRRRRRRVSLTVRCVLSAAGEPRVGEIPRLPSFASSSCESVAPVTISHTTSAAAATSDSKCAAVMTKACLPNADAASRIPFAQLLDLLIADERPVLHAAHPSVDGRPPMTARALHTMSAQLREMLLGGASPLLAIGARVATSLPSGPELAALFLALSDVFALSPLNPELSEDEVLFELGDLPAAALIVPAGRHSAAAKVAVPQLGLRLLVLTPDSSAVGSFTLKAVGCVDGASNDADRDGGVSSGGGGKGTGLSSEALLMTASLRCSSQRSRDAVALVMHTSGTTRRPKVVPLTHGTMGVGALCVAATLGLTRNSVVLNVMPLFHLHGLMVNVIVSAVAGASIICVPQFEAATFFKCLEPVAGAQRGSRAVTIPQSSRPEPNTESMVRKAWRPAPTWYSAVPTIHQEVVRYAENHCIANGTPPLHSLTLVRNCSAALAPSVAMQIENALPGTRVLPTYAMTEALPICSNPLDGERRFASVGPAAGPEVRVILPEELGGGSADAREEGEVVVRGRCVFNGYEARDHLGYDPNAQAFTPDGWLCTGDKGWMDDEGYVHLTGRFKEVINRAGEKISPLAVEHALLAACAPPLHGVSSVNVSSDRSRDCGELHGWVRELVAFGAPHEDLGETVGVAVVCEPSKTVTVSQIRRAAGRGGLLSKRWLPEVVVIVPSLPRGPTGKLQRIGLAETLELVSISTATTLSAIDLRVRSRDHEAGRRAEARKVAAAKRSASRVSNSVATLSTPTENAALVSGSVSLTTLEGCIQLVCAAMLEASGEVVGVDDDLFDAGLSSISAARMRELLDRSTHLELPVQLVYEYTTVRGLAAAIAVLVRSNAAKCAYGAQRDEAVKREENCGVDEACETSSTEMEPALLLPAAVDAFHRGDLEEAEALCVQMGEALCITSSHTGQLGSTAIKELPEHATSSMVASVLILFMSVWNHLGQWAKAREACNQLLSLRGEQQSANSVDDAILHMMGARFANAAGDGAAAEAAMGAAETALETTKPSSPSISRKVVETTTSSVLPDSFEDEDMQTSNSKSMTGNILTTPSDEDSGKSPESGDFECIKGCMTGVLMHARQGNAVEAMELASPVTLTVPTLWCNFCTSLMTLSLRKQQLRILPLALASLTCIRVLDVSDNSLTQIPREFESLSELRELLLSSNNMSDLPSWLKALSHLNVLAIQNNCLAKLPHVVLYCSKLRHLRWGLQRVPVAHDHEAENPRFHGEVGGGFSSSIEGVAALGSRLNLDFEASGSCTSLDTIKCAASRRDEMGQEIHFSSQHLAVLEMEGNGQTDLPLLHSHTLGLTALLASFNDLRAPPRDLVHYGRSLKRLHLGSNALESVDDVLPALTNLTTLCLEANRLLSLPASIGRLTHLRELWIFGNKLRTLPSELGDCESLTKLEAHHNRLVSLPDSMSRLARLKSLYLQANELQGLALLWERVLRHLPILNLGLGANQFDLVEAALLDLPGTRVGLAWNRGSAPSQLAHVLTDRLALTDHLLDQACRSHRAPILVVAFAAQGAGMQQWAVPCAAARAAGVLIDVLYLADPSNSYYMQSPSGEWDGLAHYGGLIERHTAGYEKVLLLGSSMGASAVLMHAALGHRVLAFGPRIALQRTHGSFLPQHAQSAAAFRIKQALELMRGTVAVHVGESNLEDMTQVDLLRGKHGIKIIEHQTFHHNVPMVLEREGHLIPLIKSELAALLRPDPA